MTISSFLASPPLASPLTLPRSSPSQSPILSLPQRSPGLRRPPPQKLLLLPSGSTSDGNVTEASESGRSVRSVSGVTKGPLGGYAPRPQRADSVRRRRAASYSAALQPPLPGLRRPREAGQLEAGRAMPSSCSPRYLPMALSDSQPSSPEMEAEDVALPRGMTGYKARAVSAAANYLFPVPPSMDEEESVVPMKGQNTMGGLGLDLGIDFSALLDQPSRVERVEEAASHLEPPRCYDSDALTGSQGWSPDTSIGGSNFASPIVDSLSLRSASGTRPLCIRKSSAMKAVPVQELSLPNDGNEDEEYLAPFPSQDPEDDAKLTRLRDSFSLLEVDSTNSIVDYQQQMADTCPPRLLAIHPSITQSPSFIEDLTFIYNEQVEEAICEDDSPTKSSFCLHDNRQMSDTDMAHSASSIGAPSHLGNNSPRRGQAWVSPVSLDPLGGLQAEVGDSWSDLGGHHHEQTHEDEATYWRTSSPVQQQAQPISYSPEHMRFLQSNEDLVDAEKMSPKSFCSTMAAHSPILSGLLAATPAIGFYADESQRNSMKQFVSSKTGVTLPERQSLPIRPEPVQAMSPGTLEAEFSSYLSLMETEEDETADDAEPRRRMLPGLLLGHAQRHRASNDSVDADDTLSTCHSPQLLDDLPSPTACGFKPYSNNLNLLSGFTDSRTGMPTSFSMVNLGPRSSIGDMLSSISMSQDVSQATHASSSSSILGRGRPISGSASASGFLGRGRDESLRAVHAKATATASLAGSSLHKENIPASSTGRPLIPKRIASMGRLIEALRPASDTGATNGSKQLSESEAIKRVWFDSQDSELDNEIAKPQVSISREPAPSVKMAALPQRKPSQISLSRSSISTEPGKRPRTLSRDASEALKKELASRSSPKSTIKTLPSPEVASQTSEETKTTVSEKRASAEGPRAIGLGMPDRSHSVPNVRAVSSTGRGVAASSSIAKPQKTEAAAAPQPQKSKARAPSNLFKRDCLMSSDVLPRLFTARTVSQRQRGETGITETQPHLIKLAKRAATPGAQNPQGILKPASISLGMGKVRWSKAEAVKKDPAEEQETPEGVVMVSIEETVVRVEERRAVRLEEHGIAL